MAYTGFIVEIKDIKKLENSHSLQVTNIFGSNVITSTDVQVGWKMVYFPSDGQLSEGFAEHANLVRKKDKDGNNIGGYMDPKKRNVKAIRLRGEQSDGILVSVNTLADYVGMDPENIKVGDTIDTLNGKEICKKYVPVQKVSQTKPKKKQDKRRVPMYPNFPEHIDTGQLRFNLDQIKDGDYLTISLKMHGSSQRFSITLREEEKTWKSKVKKFLGMDKPVHEPISGTRRTILQNFEGGYYGSNEFRKQYHDLFSDKLYENEIIFFEIVGFMAPNKPIMQRGNNKKLQDKKFVKRYGQTTTFTYGCEDGESDVYVYHMAMTNDQGDIVDYPTWLTQYRCEQMGVKHVPVLDQFVYYPEIIGSVEELHEYIIALSEGPDPIDPTHIREGVVVRIENRPTFTAYKEKNISFKILEGIIKEDAVEPDLEEQEGE